MEHYIVARNAESLFPYQGWPTIARDGNGVLYAATSGHRLGHVCPFGKNYLYISKDEGKTWSIPMVVNDTAHDDRDGGLCAWGDGNLLITNDLFKGMEAIDGKITLSDRPGIGLIKL